jgi:septal ring factor EnvC (AmiA/AmiB activator)
LDYLFTGEGELENFGTTNTNNNIIPDKIPTEPLPAEEPDSTPTRADLIDFIKSQQNMLVTQTNTIATQSGSVSTLSSAIDKQSDSVTTLSSAIDKQSDSVTTLSSAIDKQSDSFVTLSGAIDKQSDTLASQHRLIEAMAVGGGRVVG